VVIKEIVQRRLAGQLLTGARLQNGSAVVGWLAAMQAQDLPAAKWAVALRTSAATEAEIEDEVNNGSIVRTHVLRPTWHFVRREDIRWLLDLTAARVNAAAGHGYRRLELDDVVFRKVRKTLIKELSGNRQRTRAELSEALERAGIENKRDNRLLYILMRAELDALICNGARHGKQSTYALFDERVPAAPTINREEALHRLILCYFKTRGPATVQDFAWWSGLTVTEIKSGIALARKDLEHAAIDGKDYWYVPSDHRRSRPLPLIYYRFTTSTSLATRIVAPLRSALAACLRVRPLATWFWSMARWLAPGNGRSTKGNWL
jgi:hypothetical protein